MEFGAPVSYAKIRWCMHTNYRVYFSTQIHLHEPYSKPGSSSCQSALKIITAARAIVDLLHSISSSSFDVSLTDIYPFVSPWIPSLSSSRLLRTCTQLSWFMAGRVLVRFLKAAQDAQAEDKVICLKAEIVFLRCVISSPQNMKTTPIYVLLEPIWYRREHESLSQVCCF